MAANINQIQQAQPFQIFHETGFRITQKFGNKDPYFNGKVHKDFYTQFGSPGGHNGIDFGPEDRNITAIVLPMDCHTLVHAANDYSDGYGAYLKFQFTHQNQEYHLYLAHNDSWEDKIKTMNFFPKGTLVSHMGGSGNGQRHCFPPHLHLGIRPVHFDIDNTFKGYIDPLDIL